MSLQSHCMPCPCSGWPRHRSPSQALGGMHATFASTSDSTAYPSLSMLDDGITSTRFKHRILAPRRRPLLAKPTSHDPVGGRAECGPRRPRLQGQSPALPRPSDAPRGRARLQGRRDRVGHVVPRTTRMSHSMSTPIPRGTMQQVHFSLNLAWRNTGPVLAFRRRTHRRAVGGGLMAACLQRRAQVQP